MLSLEMGYDKTSYTPLYPSPSYTSFLYLRRIIMRLRQWLYPLVALLILAALFVGYITWTGVPKAVNAVQPHTDNGLVGWPFDSSIASWQISYGYDAPYPSDHNCRQGGICHQRYGFDFFATNHPAQG